MEEIIKHINDTNASYRQLTAGDAKNTDLFLDNEHFKLFEDAGEHITVRYHKENLAQSILFIASILPRKFDQSAIHKVVHFSNEFVIDQLAILDALFKENGLPVETVTQVLNARKDVPQKNGKIDTRFYLNGLLRDVIYVDHAGNTCKTKFTIRNYVAGGYSNLHIKKGHDGIFDVEITNVTESYDDGKELGLEEYVSYKVDGSLQQIYYGAPGTGKSYAIDNYTQVGGYAAIRTTFHPDSDYSTFVGAYKPTMKDGRITYSFVKQAFLKAYLLAWKKYAEKTENVEPQFLVIEEINRGNCAQIFGDLFQLLDRQDNGFSSYPIEADADLQAEIKKSFEQDEAYKISNDFDINGVVKHYVSNYGQNLTKDVLEGRVLLLPNNLYIWATMNTSDQSLFPIDSAFKRRWDWKYVKISDAQKGWMIQCGNEGCDWWTFVDAINKEIADKCESEDKKLGYFFCKPKAGEDVIDEERFVGKVLFYLWNDVFKDIDTSLFKLGGKTEETPTFDAFYTQNGKGETIADTEAIRQFLVNVVGEENLVADFTESNSTTSATKGSPRFVLDGNGIPDNMMNTVRNMVKKYANAHPEESVDSIMTVFNEVCNDKDFKKTERQTFILESETQHKERIAQNGQQENPVELDLKDRGKLFINRIWTNKNREVFIRKAKEMQWGDIEQVNQ